MRFDLKSRLGLLLGFALSAGTAFGQANAGKKPEPVVKLPAPRPAQPTLPAGAQPKAVKEDGAAAPKNNPKAIEIVNRYLDALGGNKVLEGINDRVTKFWVIKHAATG